MCNLDLANQNSELPGLSDQFKESYSPQQSVTLLYPPPVPALANGNWEEVMGATCRPVP